MWIETLQTYNFSLEHRAGTKHGNADALSRRPCPQSCTYCAQKEEKEGGKRCQGDDSEVTQKEWKPEKVCEARVDVDGRSNWGGPVVEGEREVGLKTLWTVEELKLAQQDDPDIGPIVECMKKDPTRPTWAGIASQSPSTKAYWAQWDTLQQAYAIPNQEAITVAKVLVEEFFCRFGVPLEIHSDQGRNFESSVFREVCKLQQVSKTRTTPLHPQSDGMVERMNCTIEAQLAMFIEQNQKDWDQYVPLLMMAYRSAVHDTTKCTPAELMMGRNIRLPIDLLLGCPEEEKKESVVDYVAQLQTHLDTVHCYARENIKIASERMKGYYDIKAGASQPKTQKGDIS